MGMIIVKNISKAFEGRIILRNISFEINDNSKIALVGENGSGKTTLLNILLGVDKDFIGEIYLNENMKISSLSQYLEVLKEDETILEYLLSTNESENIIRLYLGSVFIKGDRVNTLIRNLSMGEKCRVIFTKIILENPDLIILDEPTNYMDILSKERVSLLLKKFTSTVLVVSHDRHLISTVCNRVLKIEDNKIVNFVGNQDEIIKFFSYKNVKSKGDKLKENKDELLILQCRLSQLSGLLDNKLLEDNIKEEFEMEFLAICRRICEIKDKK